MESTEEPHMRLTRTHLPPPPPPLPPGIATEDGSKCVPASLQVQQQKQQQPPSCSSAASPAACSAGNGSAGASPKAPVVAKGSGSAQASSNPPGGRRGVLRVEVASTAQARLVTWIMWGLNLVFVLIAAGLLLMRETDITVGQLRAFYLAELIICTVCLALHLALLVWYIYSIRKSRREGRVWSKRQGYFMRTVGMLLCLQIPYSATFVVAFANVLAQDDCSYPYQLLAVMEYMQWIFFSSLMLYLLARMQNMCLWRGPGALDMHPDFRLTVDRPAREIMRNHTSIMLLWVLLTSVALAGMIDKLVQHDRKGPDFQGGCDVLVSDWSCSSSTLHLILAMVSFVLILVYLFFWIRFIRRALKDHEQLPYNRYRSTLLFVRVQIRVISPVLLAVVVSVLVLTVVPSYRDSCWASVDAQMGNLPVDLALTVLTIVMTVLYMPKAQALDSPLLQEFLQDFSWTQGGLPAAIEARNQRLLDSEAPEEAAPDFNGTINGGPGTAESGPTLDRQISFTHVVSYWQEELAVGLAKLTRVPDLRQAADQLRQEPMFCMEAAIKLYYWMRLAYRHDDALTYPFVNAHVALRLFHVDHFETIWDDTTDTHCVLGWSKTQAVVAFRGTKSIQNVLTDLKAWMAPVQPRRKRQGLFVKAHAGFVNAWLHSGFNLKVLARLRKLDSGSTPLRFWIAGHSLGGALATLAALDIQREHPSSKITCYIYGCPKVGNSAFAAEYNAAVPDTWAIINGLDPIPFVPGFGYRRVGKKVTINPKGDLMLRPSYFELSITHRGTSARHHLTSGYALSLAAVLRAQFVASKALPGGADGVASLAAAVDLGKCLVLSNMDVESLASKDRLPVLLEVLAAKAAAREQQKESTLTGRVVRRASRVFPPPGCGGCSSILNAVWLPCCAGEAEETEQGFDGVAGEGSAVQMDAAAVEQEAAAAAEKVDEVEAADEAAAQQQTHRASRWRSTQQRLEGAHEAEAPSRAAKPPRRLRSKADSLHHLRYPTFKLGDSEGSVTGTAEEAAHSLQAAAKEADASYHSVAAAVAASLQQDTSSLASSTLVVPAAALPRGAGIASGAASRQESLDMLGECSLHSALSQPEQLPDLDVPSTNL